MIWPNVTELPRSLEPVTDDTFVRDLDADAGSARGSVTPSSTPRQTHPLDRGQGV